MFCFNCGKQIRDDAVFCQYCGAQQQNPGSDIATKKQSDSISTTAGSEMDRDALKIYLGNVLSLECIKSRYQRDVSDMRSKIKNTQNRYNYYKRYYLRSRYEKNPLYAHLQLYDGIIYLAWYNSGVGYGPYTSQKLYEGDYFWQSLQNASDIQYLHKPECWDNTTDNSTFFLLNMADRRESRDAFFRGYEEFKLEAPTAYQNIVDTNNKNINNWQRHIDSMSKELVIVDKLLKQAYDINIIPSQFRHQIHAIYYFHDFLSTSRESFTTALLHFDLDEIKAKLDRIIAQQESIIIQNAVKIAQNNKLIAQNQKQLEQLAKIERNSTQAVQYAHIAANNAEVCAWISTAKYLETHR